MKDKIMTVNSQQGFMKEKSCLINLIAFHDTITSSLDKGEAEDIIYLDFNKTLNTALHYILIDKLMKYRLGKTTAR